MSLSAVSNTTKPNVNNFHNQPLKPAGERTRLRAQTDHPSVENTKTQLRPTEIEQSTQLTGNQNEIQALNAQAELNNPLTSQQFNSKVATARF